MLYIIRYFLVTNLSYSLGMVDGEFPSVTFSKGKIIKLDKEEVKNRVLKILTW